MADTNLVSNLFQNHCFPSRDQLASAIETMIAVLDAIDGDPDVEPNGDELDGDVSEAEPIFNGQYCYSRDDLPGDSADAEPEEDRCDAGDDGVFAGSALPACYCSPDLSRWDEDMEERQCEGDVPCLPVYANERGADGKREFLGIDNLRPSFRGNVKSADTGELQFELRPH